MPKCASWDTLISHGMQHVALIVASLRVWFSACEYDRLAMIILCPAGFCRPAELAAPKQTARSKW